jgi:hypothetical protein
VPRLSEQPITWPWPGPIKPRGRLHTARIPYAAAQCAIHSPYGRNTQALALPEAAADMKHEKLLKSSLAASSLRSDSILLSAPLLLLRQLVESAGHRCSDQPHRLPVINRSIDCSFCLVLCHHSTTARQELGRLSIIIVAVCDSCLDTSQERNPPTGIRKYSSPTPVQPADTLPFTCMLYCPLLSINCFPRPHENSKQMRRFAFALDVTMAFFFAMD